MQHWFEHLLFLILLIEMQYVNSKSGALKVTKNSNKYF